MAGNYNKLDDEGFVETENADDEEMEVSNQQADSEVDEVLNGPQATVFYVPDTQSSLSSTADIPGKDYSKSEVESLMKSVPYQKKIATCHLCHECWFEERFTEGCHECGGYPLTRPCPICNGQCEQIWHRNIKSSHAFHEAQWDGLCSLPWEQQHAFLIKNFSESNEDALMKSLQDLHAS
ncbi:hypothetical protein LOTGIDRAFT_237031 [Lottia gigantea]|uniref:Uncharacterized protein n=1 Tax=Lottia gigantea TaxID=225164 RepID=V4B2B3_LOTGI|nr:hypothetical protein LOTGIDRAFT_237031 [Lottia gigantea]ESO82439.1 hypothetical protein LOTGIDRAFT_237031 [Lottia gigantea]